MKIVAPAFFIDVALPSIDAYLDLSMIIKWYMSGHLRYAISMTFPIFIHFVFTIFKWVRLEKKENKWWSWTLLLLQLWPQWRVSRAIHLIYKKDDKAAFKYQELMREVTTTEPFLESWPSIMIYTCIWVPEFIEYYHTNGANGISIVDFDFNEYCTNRSTDNPCAVFSGWGGASWFFISFASSVFTGSLGISVFLKNGPYSVLSRNGPLSGMLRCKFILANQAVMWSVTTKAVQVAIWIAITKTVYGQAFGIVLGTYDEGTEWENNKALTFIAITLLLFFTLILPNLLYSCFCIASVTGVNKNFLEVIIRYPASWILPVATYFVIGPTKRMFCSKSRQFSHHLGFSNCNSIVNLILTVIMYAILIACLSAPVFLLEESYKRENLINENFYFFVALFLIPLFLGVAFNIIYLSLSFCTHKCFRSELQVIDLEHNKINIRQINDR